MRRADPRRDLASTRLSVEHRRRIALAWDLFCKWLAFSGFPWSVPPSPAVASSALVSYIQSLYDAHRPISDAVHAIICVQHQFPQLGGCLKTAWNSIESWKLEVPLSMRPPIPFSLCQIYFIVSLLCGFVLDRRNITSWVSFGVASLVAFHGLMRPVEVEKLRRQHLLLPSAFMFGCSGVAICTVFKPKNRRFAGRIQFRLVKDPGALAWLEWLVADLPPSAPVFNVSTHVMRQRMKVVGNLLGISHLKYTPGSWRPGGATELFLSGVPVDRIKFAGGWASLATLEHYIQEASSYRAFAHLPAPAARAIESVAAAFPSLPSPPLAPWSSLQQAHGLHSFAHLLSHGRKGPALPQGSGSFPPPGAASRPLQ